MSEENVNMNVSEVATPEVVEPVATPASVPQPRDVNLTLGLLTDVRQILQAAIERGSFKAVEISTVGQVYDNFTAALNTLARNVPVANETANAEESTGGSEEAPTSVE